MGEAQKWRFEPSFNRAVKVCASASADHAKGIGADPQRSRKARKRSWFQGRLEAMRPDWHDVKVNVMKIALRAKFTQDPELQALLLATGDAEIIEDSTHDPFWGIGRDGRGGNRMGRLLMNLRQEIREGSSSSPDA